MPAKNLGLQDILIKENVMGGGERQEKENVFKKTTVIEYKIQPKSKGERELVLKSN